MTGSLDTNILLRLIIGDIEHQTISATNILESATVPLSIADVVFVEMEYALTKHYRLARSDVVALLNPLIASPKINCNTILFFQALPLYIKHPALSLADIMLSIYAELNNASPLWTFDKKLASKLPNVSLLS